MNRMGFGWVFAILIAGAGWTEAVVRAIGEDGRQVRLDFMGESMAVLPFPLERLLLAEEVALERHLRLDR